MGGCCRSAGSGGWFDPSVNFAFTCLSVFALSGEVRASEFRSALCRWFPDPAIPQREFPVQIGLIQGGYTTPGIRDFAGKSGDQYGQVRKPPAFLREIRSETHLSKPLLTAKRFVGTSQLKAGPCRRRRDNFHTARAGTTRQGFYIGPWTDL